MITRNQVGDVAFTVDERDELVSTLKEIITSTEIGKLYKTEYFVSKRGDEDAEKILSAAIRVAGGELVSSRDLVRALELLMDSGEIQPKNIAQAVQLAEPEVDNRPRGRDGKLLTPQQIAWSEMTTFAQTATPDAIRQRRHTDHAFAEFVRHNLRLEMQEQPVGDAVTPAGEPEKKIKANAELVDFVHKYNRSSRDSLKPRGGYVQLDGQPLLYSTFISLVERAAQARLI